MNTQASSGSMKEFHNISLKVNSSDLTVDNADSHISTTNIRSFPLDLPSGLGNSTCPSSHRYDDVNVRRPYDAVTSGDTSSSTKQPRSDAYSEATTHTLVLSNTDNRAQSKQGHTYHLLDGSNPTEKATVIEVGSRLGMASKESSLKKNNMTSGKLSSGGYETAHTRRTTLSGVPTKPGEFDDPTYANTSITFPGGQPLLSNNNGGQSRELQDSPAAGPTRSRSLVHKSSDRRKRNTPKQKSKNSAAANNSVQESPAFTQPMSTVFDDPTYSVGLNLTNK